MKDNSQLINSILIIAGGGLLLVQLTGVERNPYFLIIGLVLLMFGLYRATNHWVYTKDDHKKLEEDPEKEQDDLTKND